MTEDPGFYDRALARVDRIAVVLGCAAVLLFLLGEGWKSATACGLAALASVYNFRRLRRMAAGLEQTSGGGTAVLAGLRFLLLGGICFALIKYFGAGAPAVFSGLLIAVAAVLIEMVYELIFTR